ncbi:DNA alkylation repair enzyme [Streptococcus pneumoniae]|nr:DNA alkylation repair enzyme [Streptococcus pneumoniae]
MQSYLKETDLPKLEQLVVTKSWWETVDILDRVVGSLVYEHPELEEIILILFENLFKPRQLYLAVYMLLTSSTATSKQALSKFHLQPQSTVLSPAASFLVCSLIFIEYKLEPIR